MRRRVGPVAVAACAIGILWTGNWAFGGGACEQALRDLEQHFLDAYSSKLGVAPSAYRVGTYRVARRVALPGFSYYEGQPVVGGTDVSCADRTSIVVWYGIGATVAWHDRVWFPDRPAVWNRFASTGRIE